MNILRIFGIVVAVHAFAFLLIMSSPGCTRKPRSEAPSSPVAESSPFAAAGGESSPFASAPAASGDSPSLNFDAAAAGGIRFTPTRPNTPAAGAVQSEPVADVTPVTTVTVGRGDSLWSIAKKHKIAVTDLAAANNLKTGAILRVGQKLIVPAKGASVPQVPETAVQGQDAKSSAAKTGLEAKSVGEVKPVKSVPNGYLRHTVKAGETIGIIARKYGVKAGDILEANNITNPSMIRQGKELLVPTRSARVAAPMETPAAPPQSPESSAPAQSTASQRPVMPTIGDSSGGLTPSAAPIPGTAQPVPEIPIVPIDEAPSTPSR